MSTNSDLIHIYSRLSTAHYGLTEYLEKKIIEAKTEDQARDILILIMRVRKIQTILQNALDKVDNLEEI